MPIGNLNGGGGVNPYLDVLYYFENIILLNRNAYLWLFKQKYFYLQRL